MKTIVLGSTLMTFLDWALSSLAPPRCRLCRAPLYDHANPYLCPQCLAAVMWAGKGACRGCGFPAGPHASLGNNCHRCRNRKLNLTAAAAVARYRGAIRQLVISLKFRGETELSRSMAGLMATRLRQVDLPNIDIILPVALHPMRKRIRGFDQAWLLAKHLAGFTGIPAGEGLIERVRHTTPQATLRREARVSNMSGAFRASARLSGTSVLLVDDVMTTGATMSECARACREAGTRRVSALVFAR